MDRNKGEVKDESKRRRMEIMDPKSETYFCVFLDYAEMTLMTQ